MANCVWCGRDITPSVVEAATIQFKRHLFYVCSDSCRTKTSIHLVRYKQATKIWIWIVIPITVVYGIVSITSLFYGFVSSQQIRNQQAILLLCVGFQFLLFPMLPIRRALIPSKWRNIRSMTKVRNAFAVACFALAALEYFW